MEDELSVASSTSLWFEPWRDAYDDDDPWKDDPWEDYLEEEESDFLKLDMDSLMRLISNNGEIDLSKKTKKQVQQAVDKPEVNQSCHVGGNNKKQSDATTKVRHSNDVKRDFVLRLLGSGSFGLPFCITETGTSLSHPTHGTRSVTSCDTLADADLAVKAKPQTEADCQVQVDHNTSTFVPWRDAFDDKKRGKGSMSITMAP